jgi:hypothetical protein
MSSPVFHRAAENVVEELTTAQAKEETAHSLRAIEIATPTTLGMPARSPRHLVREQLGTSGLKEGAAGAIGD